jgi:hypothetical protein
MNGLAHITSSIGCAVSYVASSFFRSRSCVVSPTQAPPVGTPLRAATEMFSASV